MSMLSPKRTKFRKMQKGRTRGLAKGGNDVSFGDFGLQVIDRRAGSPPVRSRRLASRSAAR